MVSASTPRELTCLKAALLSLISPLSSIISSQKRSSLCTFMCRVLLALVPCRTMEWMRLEEMSGVQLVQPLCSKQGQSRLPKTASCRYLCLGTWMSSKTVISEHLCWKNKQVLFILFLLLSRSCISVFHLGISQPLNS